MKKATSFTTKLSLYVIILFTSAMLMTFLSEYLQRSGFFGDIYYPQVNTWEWGIRHYWFAWMSAMLFIISVIRIIMWIIDFWDTDLGK